MCWSSTVSKNPPRIELQASLRKDLQRHRSEVVTQANEFVQEDQNPPKRRTGYEFQFYGRIAG